MGETAPEVNRCYPSGVKDAGGEVGDSESGQDPERTLEQANAAFAAGDYRSVRRLCASLAALRQREVAEEARALYARVTIDPVSMAVLVGCLLLLIWVSFKYVL